MATQTTDQQNALKDAMARAKEIAAKLQQGSEGEGGQKRGMNDSSNAEPANKRTLLESVDHTDPKVIAQQAANSLSRRNLGPMLVEELSVPSKIVGLVIGKGGEMINKLQSESGAKVQVAPDPPPEMSGMVQERQITITGNAEAVKKAKDLIAEIQNSGKVPEHLMTGPSPGEFSVEMNISKQKVGLIIGKGGETIKSLQERAGCKIVLFQDGPYTNAPEKLLRITGEQSTVMYAKQLIQDLLTSKELESINTNKRPPMHDGPNYMEIDVPKEAVGLIIGAKGVNIQALQSETGCRIQFKNEMEGPTKTAMLTGNPPQVAAAQEKINEIIRTGGGGGRGQGQSRQMNGGPRPPWGGAPGVQGPGGPPVWGQQSNPRSFGNKNSNLPQGHKTMIVEVPANKCGFVIGKGGETIKYIKNESKVNIQIDRSIPETSPFRIFRVQGTDEMIQKAVVIIREKINDPSINAKPEDGSEPGQTPFGQPPWGAPSQSPWSPQPQENQQWNQQQQPHPHHHHQQQPQQQWPGQQQQQQQQPGWGPQPPPPQQQPGGPWNQQSQPPQQGGPGWNQQQPVQQQQQPWNPQQQQQQQPQQPQHQQPPQPQQQPWQQQNATPQGQWSNQQQWGQPQAQATNPTQINQQAYQQSQTAAAPVVSADPAQAQAGATQAGGQPDYSAAWALYYQQQQQYYQQYAMQQPGAVSTATTAPAAAAAVPTQVSSNNPQAQALAQYQSQLAQYQNQYGQQAPQ